MLHGPLGAGPRRWRENFNRAVRDGPRCRSDITGLVIIYTYNNAIAGGVIVADDAALRDIDEALQSAQRAADDIALGLRVQGEAKSDIVERSLSALQRLIDVA